MPLSEFHLTTKTKLESPQSKMANCSSDLSSFMPDHEFVELLWENGQILVQGQSNRPRKNSFPTYFPSHTDRVQEKDSSRDAVIPKIGRFGAIETIANDFSPSGPSGQIGLNAQDDDMVPWLSYPIEDSIHSLQNDYCSDIFSEFTGVNLNSLSTHNNITPTDRNIGQTFKDTHNVEHMPASKALAGGSEPSRIRTSQLFPLPQSCQSSVPSRSRGTGFGISSNTHQGLFEDLPNARLQKQDLASSKPLQPIGGMGLMNFSHFSRPAALVKANLQSVDRLRSNEKVSTAASINPMEPTLINSNSDLKSVSRIQDQSASIPAKVVGIERSSAKPPQGVVSVEQSEAICQEDAFRNSNNIFTNNSSRSPGDVNCRSSSFTASGALGRHHESEKVPEVVVASSSVCSGNSAGAASNDPKHREKRKNREGEESGYQSEDIEDESVGLKKPATGRGTSVKRSRAAEVHNLSERRRRDRINEKMRALQELIPNCNKVDKASMLDEAIEYLKTLQLQVQIMSMGSGLCMPPMMLPAGMQHMRGPPMAHFSPMGLGMGMGMGLGFGMGMLDMNASPGCPMVPVQSMHGPQFPCPSVPGAPGLLHGMHGMHGSTSLQMFGIPGQGLPLSMPRPPQYGYLSGFSTKSSSVPENSGTAASPIPAAGTAPPSSSKDQQQQSKNLETIQKTSTDDPQILRSTQAAKECFKQSALVKMSSQTLHVSGNAAINSISEDGTASTGTTSYG